MGSSVSKEKKENDSTLVNDIFKGFCDITKPKNGEADNRTANQAFNDTINYLSFSSGKEDPSSLVEFIEKCEFNKSTVKLSEKDEVNEHVKLDFDKVELDAFTKVNSSQNCRFYKTCIRTKKSNLSAPTNFSGENIFEKYNYPFESNDCESCIKHKNKSDMYFHIYDIYRDTRPPRYSNHSILRITSGMNSQPIYEYIKMKHNF